MKNIFIALSICFCFSQAIGQSKVNKPTTEKKNIASVNELIQGKWQSIDDKTTYLVFEKNQMKGMSIENKKWIETDSEPYVLSNKCLNEGDKDNGIEPEKDKYISCKESDMCWYIDFPSKDFLTLTYMARGNTLKYKRVK